MTPTGHENFTISELERKAHDEKNYLALEILNRLEDAVAVLCQANETSRRATKYMVEAG